MFKPKLLQPIVVENLIGNIIQNRVLSVTITSTSIHYFGYHNNKIIFNF